MSPSQLTSLLVGLSKLCHHDAEMLAALPAAVEAAMHAASGQQVAQMAWALAHLRVEDPGVFAAAAQQVRVSARVRTRVHSSARTSSNA